MECYPSHRVDIVQTGPVQCAWQIDSFRNSLACCISDSDFDKGCCVIPTEWTKGLFTPSDYVTVTVTLTGDTFDLFVNIKGTARQRYGDRNGVAWCE